MRRLPRRSAGRWSIWRGGRKEAEVGGRRGDRWRRPRLICSFRAAAPTRGGGHGGRGFQGRNSGRRNWSWSRAGLTAADSRLWYRGRRRKDKGFTVTI